MFLALGIFATAVLVRACPCATKYLSGEPNTSTALSLGELPCNLQAEVLRLSDVKLIIKWQTDRQIALSISGILPMSVRIEQVSDKREKKEFAPYSVVISE